MSEQNILELLRQRHGNAVELLHKHYGPLMRYIIAPILTDEREREECLNDVCMLVWEKHEQYDPEKGGFKGWISAITRNTALNRARKNSAHDHEELDPTVPDTKAGPEEQLLRRERIEQLRSALSQLGHEEKNIFYRKYYYLQSTRQIAAELGLSERAVEGRLYRIKNKLRLQMGGEDHA